MRALGRLLYYAFDGLLWLTFVALVGLAAYVFCDSLVGLFGRVGTILIGILYVGLWAGGLYLARRNSRGKTEDEL